MKCVSNPGGQRTGNFVHGAKQYVNMGADLSRELLLNRI